MTEGLAFATCYYSSPFQGEGFTESFMDYKHAIVKVEMARKLCFATTAALSLLRVRKPASAGFIVGNAVERVFSQSINNFLKGRMQALSATHSLDG